MSALLRLSLIATLVSLSACGGSDDPATPTASASASAPATGAASAPASGAASAPAATPVVTGQRISLSYSATTADYSGSAVGIDLPELASSAFPGPSNFVTPTYSQTTPSRQVQFTFASPGGAGTAAITPGTYQVGATTGLWATVFYNEGPSNGWEGASGTLVVDAVVGDVAQYRFIDVRLVAGRRFGSTASAGSFTFNGAGNARISCLTAAQCL